MKITSKTIWVTITVIVAALVIGIVCWQLKQDRSVDKSAYQAVFLTNGQVYFGKLQVSHKQLTLTDVYYLQTQTQSVTDNASTSKPAANTSSSEIKLVKLGSELHGPQDAMYLDTNNVLFWENLKSDSKVVSAINQQKAQ